ncbi:hypothetical protein FSP39_009714 [Pinctada imbricata]|uniref:L1 transposable element RRM domain-containing protein n=1 Tax=Pinctada imbricata TaxID=66713 RepID=A0AA88Y3M1_PINIB|nr:hypothetical protein FSP39_009714 [Pinctada imbricata]
MPSKSEKSKGTKRKKGNDSSIDESQNGNNSSLLNSILGAAHNVLYGTSTHSNEQQLTASPTPPAMMSTVTMSTSTPISATRPGTIDPDDDIRRQIASTNVKLDEILVRLAKLDVIEAKLSALDNSVTSLNVRVNVVEVKTTELEKSVDFISDTVEEAKSALDTVKSVGNAVNETKAAIQDIKSMKKVQVDSQRHERTIETMCKSMDTLRKQNRELEEQITDLRWRSMKNNLIITGLPGENRGEDTERTVRAFLDCEMGIKNVAIGNTHRFGRFNRGKPRPIVIRFLFAHDREMVLRNRYKLRGSPFSVREQFPVEMEDRRRKLFPVADQMRDRGHHVKIVRDKLFVDGELYDPSDDDEPELDDREEEEFLDADDGMGATIDTSMNLR